MHELLLNRRKPPDGGFFIPLLWQYGRQLILGCNGWSTLISLWHWPTAGADDPVRGIPAGPVPAARARAADELGALGGHCRCR